MRRIFLCLAVIFFSACKSDQKKITNDLQVSARLRSQNVNSITGKSITRIGIVDTTLLVISDDRDVDSNIINFYGLKALRYLGGFGRFGNKVDEFKSPKFDNQVIKTKDDSYFLLPDANNYNIRTFSLKSALRGKSNSYKTLMLPAELVLRNNSIWLTKDSTLVGNYRGFLKSKPNRFFFYDLKSHSMEWIENFPKIYSNADPARTSNYYTSSCGFNETEGLIGSAMLYFKRVDFIGFDGQVETSSFFKTPSPDSVVLRKNILTDLNSYLYYMASFAGKKYFYATCVNATRKDYLENTGFMQLHVFDWSGKLVKIFELDQMSIGSFVVNEDLGSVYAINYETKNNKTPIIKYTLK